MAFGYQGLRTAKGVVKAHRAYGRALMVRVLGFRLPGGKSCSFRAQAALARFFFISLRPIISMQAEHSKILADTVYKALADTDDEVCLPSTADFLGGDESEHEPLGG